MNIYQGRDLVAKDVNGKKTGLQVTEHFSLRASFPSGDIVKGTRERHAK